MIKSSEKVLIERKLYHLRIQTGRLPEAKKVHPTPKGRLRLHFLVRFGCGREATNGNSLE